ncbi:MAG: UxaA family hydrolase, partial [Verrucomicrobiota bacterium]
MSLPLDTVSRLPAPTDNVAIATRRLEAGTVLAFPDGPRTLAHTVLEGHRFAVEPIAVGEFLRSWGLPFARAIAPIAPGDYVSNQSMLDALSIRRVENASFPAAPNFVDHLTEYHLDEATFTPAPDPYPNPRLVRTFQGYRRPGTRGVGTRNVIVILGTTSRTASFARQLAARLQPLARVHPGIDGLVAIAHTEGGGNEEPNNTLEVLRALAGFMVHSNVAAVLAVDYGVEPITNARLAAFMREHQYPLDAVPHAFLTLDRGLAAGLAEGERLVRAWLPAASTLPRTPEPVSELRVAVQCGGSDAFSGVSGNPLAGAILHELIRHGGNGVLTETDETMGAESYLLKNVRDYATARAFVDKIERFKEKLRWHGLTPESNPSAGNKFRGLYNIALKSLGAVHKKDPRTRLDTIIDYAEPLRELTSPGFTFMNGPGNDLEGIAGQVGAGCNLIIFVTGNGSITNSPFVPTLKITTTTRRHQLLIHEMDINAGRYLDGETFASLTAESFDLLVATASGQKTKGEHAGHSQVSLWRNWQQTDTRNLPALRARVAPDGLPLPTPYTHPISAFSSSISDSPNRPSPDPRLQPLSPDSGPPPSARPETRSPVAAPAATERVALILPTSMCSTQIARLAADRLNAKQLGRDRGLSRFVAFTHSEGCGFGGETMYRLLERTYRGYLTHPNVAAALLLEHGCEKIPNDVMRRQLEAAALPLDRYGWASVQLDGGIEKAITKIEAWFAARLAALPPASPVPDPATLTLALLAAAPVTAATAGTFAAVAARTLSAGGSILLAESDPLLAHPAFRTALLGDTPSHATLAYGQPLAHPGLHLVASETDHWVENLTGFGGNGAHLALGLVGEHAQQGHPLLPVLQFAEPAQRGRLPADDIDAFLTGNVPEDTATLYAAIAAVAHRTLLPTSTATGSVDFQLT